MLETVPDIYLSVSTTTREPRPGEVDGRDYEFVDETAFDRSVEDEDFLEWADVYGHRYGTRSKPVKEAMRRGLNVILEIDTQGADTVRANVPDAITIFLVPPSKEELARRLRERGTEDEGELELRLADAEREMSRAGEFDHVVENDDLQRASAEVAVIIEGHGREVPDARKDP
ncbi:MAG: guanylate kinase [Actinomycetota bacterium]